LSGGAIVFELNLRLAPGKIIAVKILTGHIDAMSASEGGAEIF
jgi:hypothetical protein